MSLVQDDFLAWSCKVLFSQPVAIERWAVCCLWGSSGLPVTCGSILKVCVFQTSFSSQGLHSSSLPQSLHCWGREGWAVLDLGAAWLDWDARPCIRCALVSLCCWSFHFCPEAACPPCWALPPCPCPPRGCNRSWFPHYCVALPACTIC